MAWRRSSNRGARRGSSRLGERVTAPIYPLKPLTANESRVLDALPVGPDRDVASVGVIAAATGLREKTVRDVVARLLLYRRVGREKLPGRGGPWGYYRRDVPTRHDDTVIPISDRKASA